MAESSRSSMAESSRSREQSDAMPATLGINNVGVMEKLGIYLKLAKKCMERVQGLSSPKFNNEQCDYLVDKLKATLHSASLFMEGSQDQPCGPYISMKFARQVKNFEHLVTLAKHIESFVEGCSKDAWMQSAMTLASVAEDVLSLGFNLELCGIALRNQQPTLASLTIDEVDRINKSEAKIVENISMMDADSLMKSVTLQLNSANLKDQILAKYLIHRRVGVQPKPTSNDENILFRLFEWVVSGKKFKQLGRGSSATVYEVMWLGTPVAKKTFDGPENEEFLKEVEILSQLCHPNITSMFCCHMNKRSCSIIMELMDGNLRDMIQGRLERNNDAPPFTMLEGLDIMLQVGEGVNYLHNKRIVHRDLKSANILIKSLGISGLELGYVQAKVVDFGLSKTKEKSTTYSNMTYNMGTFRWMAPEVINIIKGNQESFKANVNLLKHVFKVDIYSFAMVCFEILTGEVPFSSENVPRKVKEKILKGERPRIPDYCPLMLKTLIEKCWSQVPSERPGIGDVCLQLKYIKYLLMTSKVDQECNSLLNCSNVFSNIQASEVDQMSNISQPPLRTPNSKLVSDDSSSMKESNKVDLLESSPDVIGSGSESPIAERSRDQCSRHLVTKTERRYAFEDRAEDALERHKEEQKDEWERLLLLSRRTIKYILHKKYGAGDRLQYEDQKYIIEKLLRFHPDYAQKVGCGVNYIKVDHHVNHSKTRCFFVVRLDGTVCDFSFHKCMKGYANAKSRALAIQYDHEVLLKHERENCSDGDMPYYPDLDLPYSSLPNVHELPDIDPISPTDGSKLIVSKHEEES